MVRRRGKSSGGAITYLSYFDPYVQRALGITPLAARRRFFIDCLVSDHVVTSLSHILGSWTTFELIRDAAPLLQMGVVLPYARQYTSTGAIINDRTMRFDADARIYASYGKNLTMTDYLHQTFNEVPAPGCLSMEAIAEQKQSFLDNNVRHIVNGAPNNGMAVFKAGLLKSLTAAASKSERSSDRDAILRLATDVREHVADRLNRSLFNDLLTQAISDVHLRRRLRLASITHYSIGYLSNLPPSSHGSILPSVLMPSSANMSSFNGAPLTTQPIVLSQALHAALHELWQSASIPAHYLDTLTPESILELRKSRLLADFRALIAETTERILTADSQRTTTDLAKRSAEISRAVVDELRQERKRQMRRISRARRGVDLSYTLALSAAGTLIHPALLILAAPPLYDQMTDRRLSEGLLGMTHRWDLIQLEQLFKRNSES